MDTRRRRLVDALESVLRPSRVACAAAGLLLVGAGCSDTADRSADAPKAIEGSPFAKATGAQAQVLTDGTVTDEEMLRALASLDDCLSENGTGARSSLLDESAGASGGWTFVSVDSESDRAALAECRMSHIAYIELPFISGSNAPAGRDPAPRDCQPADSGGASDPFPDPEALRVCVARSAGEQTELGGNAK